MLSKFAFGQRPRQNLYGGYRQNTGLFTFTTSCAVAGMNLGQEQGMLAAAAIMPGIEGKGLVNARTGAITDTAAETQVIEAVFLIHKDRHTHLDLVDISKLRVKGAGAAGLDAGQILTHFTGYLPGFIMGRAGPPPLQESHQFQRLVRTGPDALTATDAGTEEVYNCTRRPEKNRPAVVRRAAA